MKDEDVAYGACKTCHGDFLAFSLVNGECYWCAGSLSREGVK